MPPQLGQLVNPQVSSAPAQSAGPSVGQLAQPQVLPTTDVGKPESSGKFDDLVKKNLSFLQRPETSAALAQFGISLLSNRGIGPAAGDAAGAISRYGQGQEAKRTTARTEQREDAATAEENRRVREQENLGQETLAETKRSNVIDEAQRQGTLDLGTTKLKDLNLYRDQQLKIATEQIAADLGIANDKRLADLVSEAVDLEEARLEAAGVTEGDTKIDLATIAKTVRHLAAVQGLDLPKRLSLPLESVKKLEAQGHTKVQIRERLSGQPQLELSSEALQYLQGE